MMKTFLLSAICTFLFLNIHLVFANSSCNDFVDEVLNDVKSDKEYFDEPYELPDNERSFGMYEAEFGHIYGLNTLHRHDDVIALRRGKNPYLKVHLAAGKIFIKSSVKRKFMSFGRSANVDVTIPLIEMTLDVVPKVDGSKPETTNLKVNEIKGLNVKVSGTGILKEFFLNAFARVAGRFFENAVKSAIEEKLKGFLKKKVLDFTIPSVCLNDISQ